MINLSLFCFFVRSDNKQPNKNKPNVQSWRSSLAGLDFHLYLDCRNGQLVQDGCKVIVNLKIQPESCSACSSCQESWVSEVASLGREASVCCSTVLTPTGWQESWVRWVSVSGSGVILLSILLNAPHDLKRGWRHHLLWSQHELSAPFLQHSHSCSMYRFNVQFFLGITIIIYLLNILQIFFSYFIATTTCPKSLLPQTWSSTTGLLDQYTGGRLLQLSLKMLFGWRSV